MSLYDQLFIISCVHVCVFIHNNKLYKYMFLVRVDLTMVYKLFPEGCNCPRKPDSHLKLQNYLPVDLSIRYQQKLSKGPSANHF